MSRTRRFAPWLFGLVGVLIAPAGAQNIDAGKSPAQIFSDTCAACHRNARELRRTSASFLRSHYTTGQEEAAAMSSYLAGIAVDPRAAQQKRAPGTAGTTPADAAKQSPRQQAPGEQAKSVPGQPAGKGNRRPATGAAATPEEKLLEGTPAPAPAATPTLATPAPVMSTATSPAPRAPQAVRRPTVALEPFEE